MLSGSAGAINWINLSLRMLSQADISALWELGGDFREVAAQQIVRHIGEHADLLFDYELSAPDSRKISSYALALLPFLREGFSEPEPFDAERDYRLFGELHSMHKTLYEALDRWLARHPAESKKMIETLWRNYPGLRQDLTNRYPRLATDFRGEPSLAPRQLMVFVTGWCNLHCPYCFSNDIARREISLGDLDEIFRWAQREGVASITPCGGEPLIYRHLPDFLRLVREYKMTTYFASNFTIDCSSLADFRPEVVRAVYVHFTEESLQNPRLREVMMRNIELAKERKIELVGRANITSTDFEPIEQWFKLLRQTGIPRLHVALTIPSIEATNSYVDLSHFEAFVPVIEQLVARADQEHISLGFAKPLPLCLFSAPIAERLQQVGYGATQCNIYEDNYMHNICLSPDMCFTPCLGLSSPKIAFDGALSWEQIGASFRPEVSALLSAPLREQCASCYLYSRRLCQGACLSYKTRTNHE